MINLDVRETRRLMKMSAPSADFDGNYTFYYDETNNIRKFYIREFDFNSAFTNNFVLGGVVYEGSAPNTQDFIDSLDLQKNVKELKLKYVASGGFLDCLKSLKLHALFRFINESKLYIHYSSVNILYWSIVDIVDSAIAHSEVSQQLGLRFANLMKNDLYKLSKKEIGSIISLFRRFKYPNIKQDRVLFFIDELSNLFSEYLDDIEFHLGLESLRQILKAAKRKGSLPFVMNEEDFVLIRDFSHFYMRPIYMFKNSRHVFDNEETIYELLSAYSLFDGPEEIKNYSFVDSHTSQLTQLSDVLVGIIGKMHSYLNTNETNDIYTDFGRLDSYQSTNISLLLKLIDKSHNKNIGFLHATDSYEEMSKIDVIRERVGVLN